ncbi:hypothetical protein TIFTF001_027919 [Ficus carica]|uniref:Uncharacterized protein n=1 Tax=Ficus carica TaxID=3494 RepID=A0AA88DP20_FICCA|nr:hypothetical protein TIFTF001_027919 [Ficus carica]
MREKEMLARMARLMAHVTGRRGEAIWARVREVQGSQTRWRLEAHDREMSNGDS